MGGHIVFVVQNSQTHEQLIQSLANDGYCALCFRSVEEAVVYLRKPDCPACVAVFDVILRRQSDYNGLLDLAGIRPELQMIFAVQEAGSTIRSLSTAGGGVRMLELPLNHAASEATLREALRSAESAASEMQNEALPARNSAVLPYSDEFLRRVGMAEVPVLLSGETGVGKEVMARRLCAYSGRADKPFLKLNCAALPPELAESELFGSAKGAFTGATSDRQGRFETAQGGTILLDEIGDMDLRLQTKLLQVLQDGEIQPLGSNRTIRVNVRVMAATHRDLSRAIQEGAFREDLYYRLNVIRIVIPPLRKRQDEILALAEALLARHLPMGHRAPVFSDELKRFLVEYRWPGNVRELENVMRRFIVYQDCGMLIQELVEGEADIRPEAGLDRITRFPVTDSAAGVGPQKTEEAAGKADRLDQLAEASRTAEIEFLLDALEVCRWNRRQAAASLNIEYKAFLYKLQKYGIVESKVKRRAFTA